jgi:hypothetical protein
MVKKKKSNKPLESQIRKLHKEVLRINREVVGFALECDEMQLVEDAWYDNDPECTDNPIKVTPDIMRVRRKMLIDNVQRNHQLMHELNSILSSIYELFENAGYKEIWKK